MMKVISLNNGKNGTKVLGKCVVEISLNCTDKRTFATSHFIDIATSCVLGKFRSELLCVLSVLEPTRYEQISALTDLDFKYRPNRLPYEYKFIFEGTGALKYFKPNFQIDHSEQWFFKINEVYHFS